MKRVIYMFALPVISVVLILSSCGSGGEKKTTKTETAQEEVTQQAPAATDEMASMMARGEQVYKEKCIACHQANGQGLAGAFPTLVGSEFLLNNKVLAVSQVLNGSEVVASSTEKKYPAPMPPQTDSREDAVAVINYVLNNFGNSGGYVTMEEVADVEIVARTM